MTMASGGLEEDGTAEEEDCLGRPHSYLDGPTINRFDYEISREQAVSLNTTVPQNYASRSLGETHIPTRNSLRHSRMIVMHRNGKILPKKYLPFVIRHYRLVKAMKVITIILGMLMSLVSVWLVLWSPTLNKIYYPYWSAVPVFCSGVVGCFYLGFCPRPYPGRMLGWHCYLAKYISIITTVVSVLTSIMVLIVCIIHLVYIHTATCAPHDRFNTTCVCSFSNTTSHLLFNDSYHYNYFTCEEVDCFLRGILATSCLLNILGLLLEVMYLCVQWHSRGKNVYVKVPAQDDSHSRDR